LKHSKIRARHALGIGFLFLQLLAIGYARFHPERFFCWAPYDEHTRFEVKVSIGEKPLSSTEIANRYQYHESGWEVRSINNVFSQIRQYESTYGSADNAEVTVVYESDGHPQQIWKWPRS
jgi:hypothetical protein